MLYTGYFRALTGNTITVNITTSSGSGTTELTFAGESPVVITQSSPDGLFSPIKSRSCTISIVTPDSYFDMYSASSHGTSVTVVDSSRNETLFSGYLTPCEYNQPYVYLNEIELEAVDRLSTLKDYKYVRQGSNTTFVSMKTILNYCLGTVAGYSGSFFVPRYGMLMKSAYDAGSYPFIKEFISEDAFKVDEDEMMSCYEVVEEICKFYNMSLVPVGNDVYFIDYELVKNNISFASSDYIRYMSLNTGGATFRDVTGTVIDGSTYAGSDHNVEIDKVYNKIKINAEIKEVDDEYTDLDPMEDAPEGHFVLAFNNNCTKTDGTTWKAVNRIFEFLRGSLFNTNYPWQTLINTNIRGAVITYVLSGNFTEQYSMVQWARTDFPYPNGDLFNIIPGQCCLPVQQFMYESSKELPYSADWVDYLFFFPQGQWLYEYFNANPTAWTSSWNTQSFWLNEFYENHFGGSKPVFRYVGDKDIEFSPSDASITNYLAFTGDILWQKNGIYNEVEYELWNVDTTNHIYSGMCVPIRDTGATRTKLCYGCTHGSGDPNRNKGWDMLKIKLKIGDKYWNGSSWTTTESTAWIPYTDGTVAGNNSEHLYWNAWEKPVTNYDYTYKIGKDAYVIPITKADGLHGKIVFEMYMPRIPYSDDQGGPFYGNDYTKVYFNFRHFTPPVIFMRKFGLELLSADSDTTKWYLPASVMKEKAKEESNDEVSYSNTISTSNVLEFSDISFKINTYNSKKPIADSYIIEGDTSVYHTQGFYRPVTGTTAREEINVVNRYVAHYSSPKKIYNCVVHGYVEPWKLVTATALPGVEFIVDEQEYDVKQDVNTLKLVEF